MKLTLVSDLHIDINDEILSERSFGFIDNLKQTDVLLIAGDTCGDANKTKEFMNSLEKKLSRRKNIKVYFTTGNHEPYDYDINGLTIKDINDMFHNEFGKNLNKKVTFLQGEAVELGNYIIFGGILGTDFRLNNNPEYMIRNIPLMINDFRYCYNGSGKLKPDYYIKTFDKTIAKLEDVCNKYPNKNIVVFTHFAPSAKSINVEYRNSIYNPFYASRLDDFIKKHENIKVWCHGHTHHSFNYKIGKCKILCKPYGYYHRGESPLPNKYLGFTIDI